MKTTLANLLLICLFTFPTFAQKTQRKLIWAEEFNYEGLPDSTKWSYNTGGYGWGNNEKQFYTKANPDNAVVHNGILSIIARKQQHGDNQYTSARLVTKDKAEWKYGRIEIRAKIPKGRGMWPAIWMLGNDYGKTAWPLCGEIDIMENVGYDPDTLVGTIHTQAYNHVIGTQKSKRIYFKNPTTEFHTYAIDWTAEKMDFLLDNKVYLSVTNEHKTVAEWPFDKPYFLILNIAVGGNWGGKYGIDDSVFPQKMEVDWVRVYQ